MRSVLVTAPLLAIATGCSMLPVAPASSSGQTARDAMLADYLGALERRDAAAIEAMVGPRADATAEIAQILERYGGVRLHDVSAEWSDPEGHYVVATVTATGDDRVTYEIRVPMGWSDDRYYLELGHTPSTGREASPESPTP